MFVHVHIFLKRSSWKWTASDFCIGWVGQQHCK